MNYRLTIYPALEVGKLNMSYRFETKEEMSAAADTTANLLLFMQDHAGVMKDYSNMFVREQKINGKWEEIETGYIK